VGELSERCDELLCFSVPVSFTGIADYYEHFPVVDERNVQDALQRHYDSDLLNDASDGENPADEASPNL
jgi:predicted phosphoribosyltransferase